MFCKYKTYVGANVSMSSDVGAGLSSPQCLTHASRAHTCCRIISEKELRFWALSADLGSQKQNGPQVSLKIQPWHHSKILHEVELFLLQSTARKRRPNWMDGCVKGVFRGPYPQLSNTLTRPWRLRHLQLLLILRRMPMPCTPSLEGLEFGKHIRALGGRIGRGGCGRRCERQSVMSRVRTTLLHILDKVGHAV